MVYYKDFILFSQISVIIPAYNSEKHIEVAINSVLIQKYSPKCQILIIDDSSADDTKRVVLNLAKKNKQITLISNMRKKGPSGARNTGLLNATGQYITFLDADDVWLPNHLDEAISFLEKNNIADAVFYNSKIIDYETKQFKSDWFSLRNFKNKLKTVNLQDQYKLINDDLFSALIEESFIHIQSMIVRKDALKNVLFNEEVNHSEDRDFCINLFLKARAKFAFKDIITVIYYRHKKSLTSDSLKNSLHTNLDHIKLFSKYLLYYKLPPATVKKIKHKLYKGYITASYCYRCLNNNKLALIMLFKSCKFKISTFQMFEFMKIISSYIFRIMDHKK